MTDQINLSPRFSIFCVVKNRQSCIARCIDSILGQDYPDFEVIVQDGGSSDGTREILEAYGDRIRLEAGVDGGAGPAFFRALERCSGEFFCGVMSDERLRLGALRRAADALIAHVEAPAIYGDTQIVDLDGRPGELLLSPMDVTFERHLLSAVVVPFSSAFFRMSIFRSCSLGEFSGAGDFDFWLYMLARGSAVYVPFVFSDYGIRADSLMFSEKTLLSLVEPRIHAIQRILRETRAGQDYRQLERRACASSCLFVGTRLAIAGLGDVAVHCARRAAEYDPDRDDELREATICLRYAAKWLADGELVKVRKVLSYLQAFPHPTALARRLERILSLGERRPNRTIRRPSNEGDIPEHLYFLSWVTALLDNRVAITALLKTAGHMRIAIYGGGEIGRLVYRDCVRAGLDVSAVFDRRGSALEKIWGRSVLTPESIPQSLAGTTVLVVALMGQQEAGVLEWLEERVAAIPVSLVSWKDLASAAMRLSLG